MNKVRLRSGILRRFSAKFNIDSVDQTTKLAHVTPPDYGSTTTTFASQNIHTAREASFRDGFDLVSIQSGYGFRIGLSRCGRLFGEGINSMGQLRAQYTADGISIDVCDNFERIWVPGEDRQFAQISCGRQHFAAVTSDGEIHLIGSNHAGQLGCRPHYRANGHHVIYPSTQLGSNVKKVVCGLDHTVILLEDGTVASFGLGSDGQLGQGDLENNFRLNRIDLADVVEIDTNGDWNLALTNYGKLFGWGNNEYRQISSDEIDQISLPTLIIDGIPIKCIGAGLNMGLVLTEENKLLSWGYGKHLEKVDTTNCKHESKLELHSEPNAPKEFVFEKPVQKIHAGLNTFAVTLTTGQIVYWGKNEFEMFDSIDKIGNVSDLNIGPDSIYCIADFPQDLRDVLTPKKVNSMIDEIMPDEDRPDANIDKTYQLTKSTYKGKNFNPNFLKNILGDKYDPNRAPCPPKQQIHSNSLINQSKVGSTYKGKNFNPNFLKNKLGDKYDPNRAPTQRKYSNQTATDQSKIDYLKAKYGENFNPNKVGSSIDPVKEAFLRGKFGDKYDPHIAGKKPGNHVKIDPTKEEFLKAKFGDKYNPSIIGKKSANVSQEKLKIDPAKEAFLKEKFGSKYNPNKAGKKQNSANIDPVKEAFLKGRFGIHYDPKKVKQSTKDTTQQSGYQGKNYDPDYLKKKFGDNYDPNR